MQKAIELAKQAEANKDVPVGALIVIDDVIVSTGYNKRELDKNATAHAEIVAIDNACKKLGGWRLSNATLYVTLEPCPMCAGAIINSRIKRVVYGVKDIKAGAFGSVLNMNSYPLNHKVDLTYPVCECECTALLSDFFSKLRKGN
jgi:tRNA(adenine34) deaminase